MAWKIMGITNHVDRNDAKEGNFDLWRVYTLQRVQEDARKWQSATSQKECKWLYNKTGICHSVLMELVYWDPTTMIPVDACTSSLLAYSNTMCEWCLGWTWQEPAMQRLQTRWSNN